MVIHISGCRTTRPPAVPLAHSVRVQRSLEIQLRISCFKKCHWRCRCRCRASPSRRRRHQWRQSENEISTIYKRYLQSLPSAPSSSRVRSRVSSQVVNIHFCSSRSRSRSRGHGHGPVASPSQCSTINQVMFMCVKNES